MLIRLTLALALALILTASCAVTPQPSAPSTSAEQSSPFIPPRWTKLPPSAAIAIGEYDEAGWDNGLILVANGHVPGTKGGKFTTYTSKDGQDWHETVPEGVTDLPWFPSHVTAGYGTSGYLVGWSSPGLTVWRTEDSQHWEAIPLETGDLNIHWPQELSATIAAGPRGVIVVASDGIWQTHLRGVHVWHSTDGRSFDTVARVTSPTGGLLIGQGLTVAEATSSGFLLSMPLESGPLLLSSEDGVVWQDISAGLPQSVVFNRISGNSSVVVAFGFQSRAGDPPEPLAWYRRGGEWRTATMDPGRLPDAGVVPANQRHINAVHNWGTGFIVIGGTLAPSGTNNVGLMWYSADGSAWARMPTRDNGFDATGELGEVAVSGNKAVLVGGPGGNSPALQMWLAEAPSPPNRPEPVVCGAGDARISVLNGTVDCPTAIDIAGRYRAAIAAGSAKGQGLHWKTGGWECVWPYLTGMPHSESPLQCERLADHTMIRIAGS